MLPRPILLLLAIIASSLFFICSFYGLVALVLPGAEALAVSCILLALAMAYAIAGWLSIKCLTNDPPDWLDGSKATLIAATLGLCAALPITIIGGYAADTAAVALTGFLGGVIPVQIWLARQKRSKTQ